MKKAKLDLKKCCTILLSVYVVFAALFLLLAQDQMKYSGAFESASGGIASANFGALKDGDVIVQTVKPQGQYVTSAEVYFSTYGQENQGRVLVELVDPAADRVIAYQMVDLEDVKDNAWKEIDFGGYYPVEEMDELAVCLTLELESADMLTVSYETPAPADGTLSYNGITTEQGGLCLKLISTNDSALYPFYLPAFVVIFAVLCLIAVRAVRCDAQGKVTPVSKLFYTFQKYYFLMEQLVSRDFKTKYKRSVLGVFWSFLNPLLMMMIQYLVFSNLFRFDIPNYAVYLLTGIVLYSSFSETTTTAMNSITGNASLITKVYVPKYIYPIAKVFSTSINLVLSLIPLLLVSFVTGLRPNLSYVFILYGIVCFIFFMVGLSFALSSFMVFFRDIQFLWGVFTTMWMYATPIMYPLDILPSWMVFLEQFNPLYTYILFVRTIIIDGVAPNPMQFAACLLWAFAALVIGSWIFKRTQDRFVLYI